VTPFLAGLGLGLSLIVAIGAQNVFVLRQGIRREHVGLVALICASSDAVLILVGVSGIGAATQAVPWLIDAVRWVGAAFLVGYGVLAARRALRPSGAALEVSEPAVAEPRAAETVPPSRGTVPGVRGNRPQPGAEPSPVSRGTVPAGAASRPVTAATGSVVLTCLALTWLNPHVYLDTVFLLGTVGATHGEDRWVFAAGAMAASVAWFFSLAYGARLLGRWLSTVRAWRVLDALIAVVMVGLGLSLVL
jgi:L-lysine exporter family protein LysE/ArgO